MGKLIFGFIASGSGTPILPSDIHLISYKDIGVLVKDVEYIDIRELAREELTKLVIGYQYVLEKSMEKRIIVPVKLGTIAKNDSELNEILEHGYELIVSALQFAIGKVEFQILAVWSNYKSILQEIAMEPDVVELRLAHSASCKGISLEDQIKIGSSVKYHLESRREKYIDELDSILKPISLEAKGNSIQKDEVVYSSAFLLGYSSIDTFKFLVQGLNQTHEGKINFTFQGPLPPYSFSTIEIKRLSYDEIDWARQTLQLGNTVSATDIKQAYYSKAQEQHPDRNAAPGAAMAFNEIARAYEVAREYCGSGVCSFDRESFEPKSILVKLQN